MLSPAPRAHFPPTPACPAHVAAAPICMHRPHTRNRPCASVCATSTVRTRMVESYAKILRKTCNRKGTAHAQKHSHRNKNHRGIRQLSRYLDVSAPAHPHLPALRNRRAVRKRTPGTQRNHRRRVRRCHPCRRRSTPHDVADRRYTDHQTLCRHGGRHRHPRRSRRQPHALGRNR